MSKSKSTIEVLPSPAAIVRMKSGVDQAALAEEVRKQVVEIMAERDALVFEPFFRSRQIAYELKRLQSVPEQEKFSISFERYGCICCETQERIHAGNGMCNICHAKWFYRWTQIIAEGVHQLPAQPAVGMPREQAKVPISQPDGVHHSWKRRRRKMQYELTPRK